MAHSNRSRLRENKKRLKAARKTAQKALWESMRGRADNKKKKGAKLANGITNRPARILHSIRTLIMGVWVLAERKVHGGPPCGNIGCRRCSSAWN